MARQHIIFVGAGISALIAALERLEKGDTVTIVERRSRADYGGQCNWAFGGFFFADSPDQRRFRIKDSHELAWQDWQSYAEFDEADPFVDRYKYWAKRYIERAVPDVYEWMTSRNMRFVPTPNWAERAGGGKGNRVPRFHLLWGCGPELSRNIIASLDGFENNGLTLLFDTEVTGLIRTGGKITGVRTRREGTASELTADLVVLASGGFTGDLSQVRERWPHEWHRPPAGEALLTGVWPEMDGSMHRAAEEVGAKLTNMSNMWVYVAGVSNWRSTVKGQGAALIPMKSALWMGADGARFDPVLLAGYDTRDAVTRVAAQDYPWSWAILNTKILKRELTIQGSDFNKPFREKDVLGVAKFLATGADELLDEFLEKCPDVVVADTVPELARKMNALVEAADPTYPKNLVDADVVAKDIATYDADVAKGSRLFTDDQLVSLRSVRAFLGDKMRTAGFWPIQQKGHKFVAVRQRLTVRKSLGGLLTDERCQVLDSAGQPIDGLFALGEATGFGGGGMNGKRTLEGTLLGGCVFTAREFARQL